MSKWLDVKSDGNWKWHCRKEVSYKKVLINHYRVLKVNIGVAMYQVLNLKLLNGYKQNETEGVVVNFQLSKYQVKIPSHNGVKQTWQLIRILLVSKNHIMCRLNNNLSKVISYSTHSFLTTCRTCWQILVAFRILIIFFFSFLLISAGHAKLTKINLFFQMQPRQQNKNCLKDAHKCDKIRNSIHFIANILWSFNLLHLTFNLCMRIYLCNFIFLMCDDD